MSESLLPSALFINTSPEVSQLKLAEKTIQEILEKSSLPPPTECSIEGVELFPWLIETKYYKALINLCLMRNKSIGDAEFAQSVNAVVLFFNSNSDDGLHEVEQWETYTKELDAEVKILVCEQCQGCDQDSLFPQRSRVQILNWCISNGYELVELNPQLDEEDSDVEDDFKETLGIQRIIQALHAHVWPNLTYKKNSNSSLEYNSNLAEKSDGSRELSQLLKSSEENLDESFEEMFKNLSVMKSKAESLPLSERRDYAEKIAMAFWEAFDGSDSE